MDEAFLPQRPRGARAGAEAEHGAWRMGLPDGLYVLLPQPELPRELRDDAWRAAWLWAATFGLILVLLAARSIGPELPRV